MSGHRGTKKAGLVRTGDHIEGVGTVLSVRPGAGHLTVVITTDNGVRQLGADSRVKVS